MKRILIAFDDTPGAEAAMRDLVRGGFPDRCEARVLSIADVWLPPETVSNEPSFPDRVAASHVSARQNALEELAKAKEMSIRGAAVLHSLFPNWVIHSAACADSPAWGIIAEAHKWPADLIVIGSQGRSALQKFFLGSVSYKVAAEASCSVRVFKAHRRDADGGLSVMVGIDGSSDSEAAFNEALSRKWPAHTKFQLITVIDQKIRTAAIADAGSFLAQRGDLEVRESVGAMLEKRAERIRNRAFEVHTQLLDGDPKTLLLHHADAWKADCIFLGARGLQHGDRLYLGTFASAVVTRAHCTVEIVRPSTVRPGELLSPASL